MPPSQELKFCLPLSRPAGGDDSKIIMPTKLFDYFALRRERHAPAPEKQAERLRASAYECMRRINKWMVRNHGLAARQFSWNCSIADVNKGRPKGGKRSSAGTRLEQADVEQKVARLNQHRGRASSKLLLTTPQQRSAALEAARRAAQELLASPDPDLSLGITTPLGVPNAWHPAMQKFLAQATHDTRRQLLETQPFPFYFSLVRLRAGAAAGCQYL